MAYCIVSPFMGKNKPKTPMQWIKFPWEEHQTASMIPINESKQMALDDIFKDFSARKNAR